MWNDPSTGLMSFQRSRLKENGTSPLTYPTHSGKVSTTLYTRLCSLQYTTVEDVASVAAKLGQGALSKQPTAGSCSAA